MKAIFRNEKEENIIDNQPDDEKYAWRLVTKYFQADLKLSIVRVNHQDNKSEEEHQSFLDQMEADKNVKPEAFIYLFENLDVLHSKHFMDLISNVYERYSPELSIIFRNHVP